MNITLVCTLGAGRKTLPIWGARILGDEGSTKDFLDVAPPYEGDQDVREEVGGLVEVLALYVSVRDSSHEGEGFEGQHCYDLSAEVGPNDVDHSDHQ
jgi:hypothetical protein